MVNQEVGLEPSPLAPGLQSYTGVAEPLLCHNAAMSLSGLPCQKGLLPKHSQAESRSDVRVQGFGLFPHQLHGFNWREFQDSHPRAVQ